MRGASTLIPARFLTLVGHLCVLITLLWESQQNVKHCLPSQYHSKLFQIYHSRLVGGLGAAVALALIELTTFILGLTMFSSSVALTSIFGHGASCIMLSYFLLDGWLCDWFWPLFVFGSVMPAIVDLAVAAKTIFAKTHYCTKMSIFFQISNNEHEKLTQYQGYRSSWSFYLVLCGVVTTLGSSLPVGYNIGVVNTPAEVIKHFCNESIISRYNVELSERWLDTLWSCIVSIFIVGGCTGSVLGAVLANSLGRKKATIVTSVLSLAGALLFLLCRAANSVEMLILGRLLVGLSAGLTTSIVPMYLTELSPLSVSGAMGVACPMGVNVGVLAGQLMGLKMFLGGADEWPYLLSVYAILVIICLPILFILPESPKYLYVIRKDEETALRELSRLRGVSPSLLTEEVELLREESRAAERASLSGDQHWSLTRALTDSRLRLPLLLVCSMQMGQQTSGINAVFYYSSTIFKQAGLSAASSQYATIGCGAVNVGTAVLMVYLLPRVGRRPLLVASITAAAAFLTALAACMNYMMLSGMSYVCIVAVLGYVIAYGFGLGPIPYFVASEIFEVGPRPAGMAWGSLANWLGNFLVGMCFPLMRDTMGPYSFLVFATLTAALAAFHNLYFPETRGKTPTQVAQLCSRGFRSRPNHRLHINFNV